MSESKTYQPVWNKYFPVIILKIKSALKNNDQQQFSLDRMDFENASQRKNAKFQFNIETREGRSLVNKKTSPVGRDFVRALIENEVTNKLIKEANFKFDMNTKFVLSIQLSETQQIATKNTSEEISA